MKRFEDLLSGDKSNNKKDVLLRFIKENVGDEKLVDFIFKNKDSSQEGQKNKTDFIDYLRGYYKKSIILLI